MKLKFCVMGLAVSVLVSGYGIITGSSADDNGKISKTIDTIRGYFKTNDNGETYGTYIDKGDGEWEEPDLMAVIGVNDVEGYVKKVDLYDEENQPNNPEQAIAYMEKREKEGPRLIPIYEKDGRTVIGEYRID
ncbi:hypothetical protein QJR30_08380 [Paraclostridium sordellii]|uniref:hypothetical protein n=1 Tax=Paraclostridium sordellii TaxID=1505 RepID=UPI0005E3939A|nr:hypothetical protein [Paeniclostridium sordellii]CEP80493.1 beta-lactamase inducer [[Clostridium] sordellii] [Paeniclostridium sordellii]